MREILKRADVKELGFDLQILTAFWGPEQLHPVISLRHPNVSKHNLRLAIA